MRDDARASRKPPLTPGALPAMKASLRLFPVFAALGAILFFADPVAQFICILIFGTPSYLSLVVLAIICYLAGIWIGMTAERNGYNAAFTAGGAGFLAGTLRSAVLFAFIVGATIYKFSIALPIFGVYGTFTFLGGLTAWALRKFWKIQLKRDD